MTFEDLPDGWADEPLTDPQRLADAMDLFCSTESRHRGGLLLLLCREDLTPLKPIAIDDVPVTLDYLEQLEFAYRLAEITHTVSVPAAALAVCRRGHPQPTSRDENWARAFAVACADHDVCDVGTVLATVGHTVPVETPLAA